MWGNILHRLQSRLQVLSFSIAKSQSRLGSGDIRDPIPGPSQRSESDRGIAKEADGRWGSAGGRRWCPHLWKEWASCVPVCVTLAPTIHMLPLKLVKIHNQTTPGRSATRRHARRHGGPGGSEQGWWIGNGGSVMAREGITFSSRCTTDLSGKGGHPFFRHLFFNGQALSFLSDRDPDATWKGQSVSLKVIISKKWCQIMRA